MRECLNAELKEVKEEKGTAAPNAIKLTPEKTTPLKIVGEVGTTRKQTQEAANVIKLSDSRVRYGVSCP